MNTLFLIFMGAQTIFDLVVLGHLVIQMDLWKHQNEANKVIGKVFEVQNMISQERSGSRAKRYQA